MLPLHFVATGKALPANCLTASALDARLGLKEGTSFARGGVAHRYFANPTDSQSALGAEALHDALARASLRVTDIDLLISACGVQEQALPSTACAISAAAGLPAGIPAFDVNASCLSFLTALQVAASLLHSGAYRRIAIVSADLASRGINWDDPESAYIFGDGAAAAIVEQGAGTQGLLSFALETYTEGRAYCEIRAGGTRLNPRAGADDTDYLFRMDGKGVFKLASKHMPGFLDKLLASAQTALTNINVVVPHQASHLGMTHVQRRLGLPEERVINIYSSHGNQVASSIPTALHEAFITGKAAPGKKLLLLGTAAGLSLGGAVVQL